MDDVRLIDANALRERMRKAWDAGCISQIEDVESVLDEQPTIDPETLRPVAHWENECDAVGDPICWTCTNCKESACMYEGTPKENGYEFCPFCGAKMEDDDV